MRRTLALLFGLLLAFVPSSPASAETPEVVATLDGRSISASRISDYACHDLEFPLIRCFREATARDTAVSRGLMRLDTAVAAAATAAVVYVTIWDGSNFTGASMSISQDYDALAVIGWNDRVSSFKGRNSESGKFTRDWFGGGTVWNFCCNQQTGSLGSYSNTFSAVYRT